MKLVILLLAVASLSTVSAYGVSSKDIPVKKKSLYELALGQNPEAQQTGFFFTVHVIQNSASVFEKSFLYEVKKEIEDILRARKYVKAKNPNQAHLEISVELYKNVFFSDDKSDRFNIKKEMRDRDLHIELAPGDSLVQVDIIGWARSYMALRQPLFHLHVKTSDRYLEVGQPSVSDLVGAFSHLKLSPPDSNKNMKGMPGCYPELGYEYDFANRLGEAKIVRVSKIKKGSSSAKAGLKLGDIIQSIAGMSYGEGWTQEKKNILDEQILNQKKISFKIRRGGQTIDLEIRARPLCSYREIDKGLDLKPFRGLSPRAGRKKF